MPGKFLGIDIDGVIVDFYNFIRIKGEEIFGIKPTNLEGYGTHEMYPNISHDDINRFHDLTDEEYFCSPMFTKYKDILVEYLNHQRYFKYKFLTGRLQNDSDVNNPIKIFTDKLINELFPNNCGVIYYGGLKGDIIKELNIGVMIEDWPLQAESISKQCPVIMPRWPYNEYYRGKDIFSIREPKQFPDVIESVWDVYVNKGGWSYGNAMHIANIGSRD